MGEHPAKVDWVEDDDVIQAFAPKRADQPFHVRRLPARVRRDAESLASQGPSTALELLPVNTVFMT